MLSRTVTQPPVLTYCAHLPCSLATRAATRQVAHANPIPNPNPNPNPNQVAHEHFMLRLPALDDALSTFLERHAAGLLRDTVVMLLSDHGTHGIWYNDYEIGAAEHKLPVLYVLAPDWLMRERPAWQAALRYIAKCGGRAAGARGRANLTELVLGCIEAKFCKKICV